MLGDGWLHLVSLHIKPICKLITLMLLFHLQLQCNWGILCLILSLTQTSPGSVIWLSVIVIWSTWNGAGVRALQMNPRILERPGLKRTTMTITFQPPAVCKVANQQTRLPRATSSLALNASRDGASTASLDNLFHCVTTLWVKNCLLISNLNLRLSQFKTIPPCPITIHPSKQPYPSCIYAPFKYWKAAVRSPWSLLFSKLNKPSSLNLSSCIFLRYIFAQTTKK